MRHSFFKERYRLLLRTTELTAKRTAGLNEKMWNWAQSNDTKKVRIWCMIWDAIMPLVSEHGWKQQDDMANVWVSASKKDDRKQRKLDLDMHEGARAPCEVLGLD